jgi:hypothetical protein
MKYRELQTRLKQYQAAELTGVKLNANKSTLEREYQRCLQLNLSQKDLESIIYNRKNFNLSSIDPFYIYTNPEKFPLPIIKNKTYQIAKIDNLQEFRLAFPILKDKKYDFRTKKAWNECLCFVNCLTKDSQEFEQFKQEIQALIISMKQQQYQQLRGETAVEEAYEDLSNYISWWKGAQWEFALCHGVSPLDLLKRTWLEEYLPRHNLEELLNYNPVDRY